MKTFRFIGMALFAVLMCVNLASCSSSDDDPTEEGGVVVSGKKIAKIVRVINDEYVQIFSYSYDKKGRLAQKIITNGVDDPTPTIKEFIWGDDVVKVISGTSTDTYIIENGRVRYCDDGFYSYNKSNRFIYFEEKSEYPDIISAIWEDDKMVLFSDQDRDNVKLTYEKSCAKGYFPIILVMPDFDLDLMITHPDLFGMRTVQLPAKRIETNRNNIETYSYTYEFDKEGYISKMTIKGNEDNSLWTYDLTWK